MSREAAAAWMATRTAKDNRDKHRHLLRRRGRRGGRKDSLLPFGLFNLSLPSPPRLRGELPDRVPLMNDQPMLKVERLTKTYATAAGPLTVLREVSFELGAPAPASRRSSARAAAARRPCWAFARGTRPGREWRRRRPRRGIPGRAGRGRPRPRAQPPRRVRFSEFPAHSHPHCPGKRALVPLELRRSADSSRRRFAGPSWKSWPTPITSTALASARAPVRALSRAAFRRGEQQRVALARSFRQSPQNPLLCDEPTGNLGRAIPPPR